MTLGISSQSLHLKLQVKMPLKLFSALNKEAILHILCTLSLHNPFSVHNHAFSESMVFPKDVAVFSINITFNLRPVTSFTVPT